MKDLLTLLKLAALVAISVAFGVCAQGYYIYHGLSVQPAPCTIADNFNAIEPGSEGPSR